MGEGRAQRSTRAAESLEHDRAAAVPKDRRGADARSPRAAVWLMSVTSVLSPMAGVLTQPVLARALGPDGRGVLAAALAPAALAVAAGTLGLPDAVTFYVAKHPRWRRPVLIWGMVLTLVAGVLGASIVVAFSERLSGGNGALTNYIVFAAILSVPTLVMGVFGGVASGMQLWGRIAIQRSAALLIRVGALVVLYFTGSLNVVTAIIVTTAAPLASGVLYLSLLSRINVDPPAERVSVIVRTVVSYGARVWVGSVASMTLSRVAAILIVPLSTPLQLGFFSVAQTISDVPLVVALGIQGAVFGLSSKDPDINRVATVARMVTILTSFGCGAMAASVQFWLGPLFGAGFSGALLPTLLLLASSVVCVPGIMASSGIAALGRPTLRSVAIFSTLLVNAGLLIVLVPVWGAAGASLASLAGNIVFSGVLLAMLSKLSGVAFVRFLPLRVEDFKMLYREIERALGGVVARLLHPRASSGDSTPR
jgi:O-antigen/teichoic acid export membrane protein